MPESNFEFTIQDEPDFLTSKQTEELYALRDKWLEECKICNHSGYLPGDITCKCMKRVERKNRLLSSNIPRHYTNVHFEDFRLKSDIGFKQVLAYSDKLGNARSKGIGIHLYSKAPGTGKTLLAICILLQAIKKGYTVWFTSLEQLVEDVKLGFNNEKQRRKMEYVMFKCNFLVLDEISKIQSTVWRDSKINDLIQRRVNECLPIISTDNLSIDQLQNKFPEHLISRFAGTQIEVALSSKIDYRKDVKKKNLLKDLMKD